ncbi:MAG TPA: hypothetical protein VKJ65_13755 [Phycisphaerae bacterium]|nr:hypothetical protein [Phycisphaerae bacterium]
MPQNTLTHEDYRVIRFCYERGGKIKPAELTVKWRAYHDHRGAARAKLDYLVSVGVGQWKGTIEHPQAEYFFLNKAWMEYFDNEKSKAFKQNVWGVVAIVAIGLLTVLAGVSVQGVSPAAGIPGNK